MHDLSDIRILMLAPCLGKFGGIESFCLTLCDDILKKGAIVTLIRKKVKGFNPDSSIERNEREISSTWTANQRKNFSSQYLCSRDKKIRQAINQSDIVHLHNPMVEGVWWAKRERKPCVMTVYNWRRKGFSPRIFAWKWAVKNSDRRWYISEFVWNSWEKIRHKGSARLPVISKMPQGQCPINKRKGFLFVGRFVPNKGIRLLLNAYHRVSPDPDLWPLTLVGDGPLRDEVSRMVSDKSIHGVNLTGFISESERHKLTKNAKWMVTPPNTNEDLGLTPLEARSVGVPCIASNDGGIPETAGKNALFCKRGCVKSLADRLQEAVNMNETEYKQKALATKENLQDYIRPLDEYAQNYLQLLHLN